MSQSQEWESWKSPPAKDVSPAPAVGAKAPEHPNLALPTDKPTIIVFLRHCGCPFAEKSFKELSALSASHPEVHCVAVSHSSAEATERWVVAVGGSWDVQVVIDEERELYARWGMGISNAWHVLSPKSLYNAMRIGMPRPTESGSRWQTSGDFAVGKDGIVRRSHVAASADDLPDFHAAMDSLGIKLKPKADKKPAVATEGFL